MSKLASNAAQGQTDSKDCGVFEVAFAMALCNEMVPEELTFYQERMRGYLQFCLDDAALSIKTSQLFCQNSENRDSASFLQDLV